MLKKKNKAIIKYMIQFGPAGNTASFEERGIEPAQIAPWLKKQGLTVWEYQCGKGTDIGRETAQDIGRSAKLFGVSLSVHSHYYINLSSAEKRRMQRNEDYLNENCRLAQWLGADRITVHCGGLSGQTRKQAFLNTRANLKHLIPIAESYAVALCVETMGRINMLGDLEEVLALCRHNESLIPCIDFGHLNARGMGSLKSREDFCEILTKMKNALGRERIKHFHAHFSKIQYDKSGEVRHLTFRDKQYGPSFEECAYAFAEKGVQPRVICESAGMQVEDALQMKKIYESIAGAE